MHAILPHSMCCESLQSVTMQSATELDKIDPTRDRLLEVLRKIIGQCPRETRSHVAKIAKTPLPPESEAIPGFFRRNPDETDFLEEVGALTPLLR